MAEATTGSAKTWFRLRKPAVGGEDDRALLVASADHLEDPVGGGLVEGQGGGHPDVVGGADAEEGGDRPRTIDASGMVVSHVMFTPARRLTKVS